MKKKSIILIANLCLLSAFSFAQSWFCTYADSATLVQDADKLVQQFIQDVQIIHPEVKLTAKPIVNTRPMLIFYGNDKVNLPLWKQLPAQSKQFFTTVGGNERKSKKIFGLFFNGFYLPHELGHALQNAKRMNIENNRYESEYQANVIAILWWRKTGHQKDLSKCYKAAKSIMSKLKNPFPDGETIAAYFTKDYWSKVSDPFVYGYMQFSQFTKIYEDRELTRFEEYIRNLK